MFARLAAVSTLSFAVLAAAHGACNTGDLRCCNSIEDPKSVVGTGILAALGLNVQNVAGQIGVECSPITVIGVGSSQSCSAKPVCCSDNSHGSAVSLGCVPVSL